MDSRLVSEEELQGLFNRLRIWEREQEGELIAHRVAVGRWKRKKGDLKGTRWETWSFRDRHTDLEVARTHQHVRRNGTLAGSQRPDPKSVYHDGVLYVLDLSRRRTAR